MNDFAEWWRARTLREQRLLMVMFALLALVLIWLAIIRPLAEGLDRAQRRYAMAVETLGEARRRSAAIRGTAVSRRPPQPLDAFISRTATEAGFAGARVSSRGPARASVAIDAARPQALFGWVARLEQQGAAVASLRARPNPDRTVTAEITFAARAR